MSKSGTVNRTVMILCACAENGDGISFTELRRVCGDLQAMTLSRILKPLMEEGMVRKTDSGMYACGEEFERLAAVIAGTRSVCNVIEPISRELSKATGESCAFFEWEDDWVTLAVKHEAENSFHYVDVGGRYHGLWNSSLLVCLAYFPRKEVERLCRPRWAPHWPEEIPWGQLDEIRRSEVWVHVDRIRGGILRVIAPIFRGEGGPVAGSLGITSLETNPSQGQLDHFKQAVKAAAARACRQLNGV